MGRMPFVVGPDDGDLGGGERGRPGTFNVSKLAATCAGEAEGRNDAPGAEPRERDPD